MGNLFAELKRRHIYRAGAAYAVAAFALIEIVSNVAPMFDLPAWFGRGVVLLLAIGFPVTLLGIWLRDLPPADGATARAVTGKLDIVLIGALVVVIGFMGYDRFAPTPGATTAQQVTTSNGAPSTGVISIAVLPFVNLSSDKEQEFFSDGITEEITSALAKVKDLRVVGRTSAFEFKGQNKDLRAIGEALSASHLLEGSVRKSGSRVRITAQLIRADDGTHLWTENYDRELTDIFATQDDIAQAIAGALRIPLGLKAGETLVAGRTADPELHQQYLRAKALWRARASVRDLLSDIHQVIAISEQVVARDPGYGPAWALLAQAYAGEPSASGPQYTGEDYSRRVDSYLSKAEVAGRRAIELDPQNADSYVGLAYALQSRGKYAEAEDIYKQALKIDAFNPDLLHFYSQALLFNGRIKEAVAVRQQLQTLEPIVPNFNAWTAMSLMAAGQYEAALPILKALPIHNNNRRINLIAGNIYLGRGGDAADVILSYSTMYKPDAVAAAVRLLRMPPTTVAPKDLPELAGELSLVYVYVGAPERAFPQRFSGTERLIDAGYNYGRSLWEPTLAPVRKTERFKVLMRKAGLPAYWRARGWPDVCHPVGADDFACE